MKPISLRMKSFGSYVDETIDFSGIDGGIFLVTGDTGAGKTTIFDAICYALYGVSSGGKRDASMMVSQYAKPGDESRVEFDFSIGDDVYKIKRIPTQKKYRRRINDAGETYFEELKGEIKASVELTLPDKNLFPGRVFEINEKIREIIGIDVQQFTQITMLAQGDFLKLLHASSNERQKIFSEIFDTHIYYAVENELSRRAKESFGNLEDNRAKIVERLEDVVLCDDSDLCEEWEEKGCFGERTCEIISDLIGRICDELSSRSDKLDARLSECDKQLLGVQAQLDAAALINADFDKLCTAENRRDELEQRKEEMAQRKNRIAAAKRALRIEGLYTELSLKRNDFNKKNEGVKRLEVKLSQKMDTMKPLFEQMEEAEKAYNDLYDDTQRRAVEIESRFGDYDELAKMEKEYKAAKDRMAGLADDEKRRDILADKLEQKKAESASLLEKYEKLKELHAEKYEEFIRNQAAILRRELVEGKPCPVCGSIHHDVPCEKDVTEISRIDVDKAKANADNAEKLYTDALSETNHLSEKLLELTSGIEKEMAAARTAVKEKEDRFLAAQKKLTFETKDKAYKAAEELRKNADLLRQNNEKAHAEYQNALTEQRELEAALRTEKANLDTIKKDIANSDELFKKGCSDNGFCDEKAFLDALLGEDELENLIHSIEEYEEAVKGNTLLLNDLKERTIGKKRIDVTELNDNKLELDKSKNAMAGESRRLYSMLECDKKAKDYIEEKYAKRELLRKNDSVIRTLSLTASGNLSGKIKMNFRTYVQRRYFKRIIAAANQRLGVMSNRQFALKCKDIESLGIQGAAGLDLDIYSAANDQLRDVKTLSGGESFQAALSMALGLSDVIQSMAGRIRIDTMFIDEGFGSLSEDARNHAIELLNELSGGSVLIGIISHVTELKEQIETKLVVTKDDDGSHAKWER